MIVGSNILAGASGQQGYFLNRSVRLRSSASAYFNRAVISTSNTALWTYSEWVKLGVLSTDRIIFGAGSSSTEYTSIYFDSSNRFNYVTISGGVIQSQLISTPVYRDPSSFYHLVFTYDSAQATSSNRLKLYINGVQVTVFTTATYPSINASTYINNSVTGGNHFIGKSVFSSAAYFDGYLTEINFIDGQGLTPTSFGAFNPITGVWQPIKYIGTYGTNGFYLNFNDNSAATAAAIGKDSSGNGNNWTPNNISVTAGATYDSMTDVPTLTSPTTSNFCVGNPLNSDGSTWTNANLNFSLPNSTNNAQGTMAATSGKFYWEVVYTSGAQGTGVQEIGLRTRYTNGIIYAPDGSKYINGTNSAYGAAYTTGDVIGVALDMTGGTVTFYKNNASQGAISISGSGMVNATFSLSAGGGVTSVGYVNFGQRSFTYTPPTGFVALNTYNLPTPTISNGANQFAATTYTGNGTTQTITNGGNNSIGKTFQPDLVWLKQRSPTATGHLWEDSVRGTLQYIGSESTAAESTVAGSITSFNSNGFSIGNQGGTNANGAAQIAWQWKASNASAVTNTSGSISSQVSANPTAGFSIVTYTGTGANATVGHGLGIAPSMIIVKSRSVVVDWAVYHRSIGNTAAIFLNLTNAPNTSNVFWNNTTPTSSVFNVGINVSVNQSSATYVAYAFSEIAGFSKFGSYTGNGSTDGPFVYLGFRPRFVLTKRTDSGTASDHWLIKDTSRSISNVANNNLYANLSNVEDTVSTVDIDLLSNGFKIRGTYSGLNASGGTFIYAAFAENPFNYSLAR